MKTKIFENEHHREYENLECFSKTIHTETIVSFEVLTEIWLYHKRTRFINLIVFNYVTLIIRLLTIAVKKFLDIMVFV